MATRSPKVLADGQLPSSKGTLYTAPSVTQVYVSMISIVNTGATAQTVTVYYKKSTSRVLFTVDDLQQNERIEFKAGLILDTGDLIEGVTTTASQVDYVITGVKET